MSAKPIYEWDAKVLLSKYLGNDHFVKCENVLVTADTDWQQLREKDKWLNTKVSFIKFLLQHIIVIFRVMSIDQYSY